MRLPRALLGVVLVLSCSEVGLTVDISAKADVPALDAVRVQVVQGALLVEQTFTLGTLELPQSVAIVSKGLTRGNVDVTVQGLKSGRVEALAHTAGELKPATQALRLSALLERLCPPGSPTCGCTPLTCGTQGCGQLDDGCGGLRGCGACASGQTCRDNNTCGAVGCTPKTCAQLNATCGTTLDGCGNPIDCGPCAKDTCGGGGVANQCGPGTCSPRAQCDAGLECGSASDGCAGLIACGTCDAGACGTDLRCNCTPRTSCPSGKECGKFPDGCGGDVDCGNCMGSLTCRSNNTCCRVCLMLDCGSQPDGCGGMNSCGQMCPAGRICGPRPDGGTNHCNCAAGLTECNGACVDLMTSNTSCGACGRTCPGGQSCHGGLCPCVDAGSNTDGHCCPPGWVLAPNLNGGTQLRCYRGPFDAGTESQGLTQCRAETQVGYGAAVSALGAGLNAQGQTAAPFGACGSFLLGTGDQVIDAETGGFMGSTICTSMCSLSTCVCTTCQCSGFQRGCEQKYYCAMDPLGPRVEGMCFSSTDCPPGNECLSGNCVDAGVPFCVASADCPLGTMCALRGNGGHTGLCK